MKLLSHGDGNTKLAKSNRLSDFTTYGLSLAPADESGYQTCSSSTIQCRVFCIFKSGNGSYPVVVRGRIRKTIMLFEERIRFEQELRADLHAAVRKAKREHKRVAVRLNVFSDLQWESLMPWIFVEFPGIQFYDYTKHYLRMHKFLRGELPNNYHLTFSRSEVNERQSIHILFAGGNVAVVFERLTRFDPTIPESWHGISVLNGDQTDLRFLERKQGKIIGLYAKGSAMGMRDQFVVNAYDARQPLLSAIC
jgi:hypothetical protein